ncbi:MAG: GxxExxY protein [Planctomycetes bacterium]|uniref:GxxExxY protein n=1 Tax=Candidatus Wunengus sp. YC65 TaxID=3367701 RepID=UPI001D7C3D1B|nr:GxxExxY protein [Planctomycetota bacterium]MBI5795555.1 GxxExxY protein [Planctomycetota bacterium]
MTLELEELTGKIISCAIEVHKKLGPGFLESIYQVALPMELVKQKLKVETQKAIKIFYEGKEIGLHRLDLVVEDQIVVELKTVKDFDESHIAQLISYLNATGLKVGLLFNFAKAVLKIKRVVS